MSDQRFPLTFLDKRKPLDGKRGQRGSAGTSDDGPCRALERNWLPPAAYFFDSEDHVTHLEGDSFYLIE